MVDTDLHRPDSLPTPVLPPNANPEKIARWNRLWDKFSQERDSAGYGIEPGALETVVALNACGVVTYQSCEGHPNENIEVPWVETGDRANLSLEYQVHAAFDAYESAKAQKSPGAETLLLKARELEAELLRRNIPFSVRAAELLDGFYKKRDTPFIDRLVLRETAFGKCSIQPQGDFLQRIAPPDEKIERLRKYRVEMRAFTDFLKDRFFYEQ